MNEQGWHKPMSFSNLETAYFGTGGKGPAGATHSASILPNGDGTYGADFTRLNPRHGGESGGRALVQDGFASREDAIAWAVARATAAKVGINTAAVAA